MKILPINKITKRMPRQRAVRKKQRLKVKGSSFADVLKVEMKKYE